MLIHHFGAETQGFQGLKKSIPVRPWFLTKTKSKTKSKTRMTFAKFHFGRSVESS